MSPTIFQLYKLRLLLLPPATERLGFASGPSSKGMRCPHSSDTHAVLSLRLGLIQIVGLDPVQVTGKPKGPNEIQSEDAASS